MSFPGHLTEISRIFKQARLVEAHLGARARELFYLLHRDRAVRTAHMHGARPRGKVSCCLPTYCCAIVPLHSELEILSARAANGGTCGETYMLRGCLAPSSAAAAIELLKTLPVFHFGWPVS
jgi:hypothetical protein